MPERIQLPIIPDQLVRHCYTIQTTKKLASHRITISPSVSLISSVSKLLLYIYSVPSNLIYGIEADEIDTF